MDQVEKCTLLQPQGVNPETLHSYSTFYRPLAIKSPVIHVQTHNYSFSLGPLMFPQVCAMRGFGFFSISQHTVESLMTSFICPRGVRVAHVDTCQCYVEMLSQTVVKFHFANKYSQSLTTTSSLELCLMPPLPIDIPHLMNSVSLSATCL